MSGEATSWLEFLSEASQHLGASLDYNVTLDSLARLTVPRLADWCDIQMLDDAGILKRVSMIHRNPALVALAEDYSRRYPYEAHSGQGVPQPLIAGAMLFPHVTDEILQGYARRPEELEILRQFGCRSIMLLPLTARQRRLGLMVLASSESGRTYDADDLRLAEELAARASLAVDNARLYAAEQQARALAEEALRARIASERQLHAILDHSPAMIYVSDRQGRLVMVNREYERRSNRTAAELIGRTVAEILPKDQADLLRAYDERVIAQNQAVQFEVDVGSEKPLAYFSLKFPLTDSDGNVTGLCGIATDISARKEAEEALRLSQDRFEKVFRAATIAITITRQSDGHIIDANPAAEALSGYPLSEMLGKTTTELGWWADEDGRDRAFSALRSNGSRNFEARLRDRQGKLHDVLMTLEVIELAGQSCYVSLAQEVTELKHLNLRLERVHKMEALGRLAGGIAHDFNNILTAINGYSRLVLDAAPPGSPIHASAIHIERAAARAAGLTQQLLVFGRQQVQERAVVDLNAAVRNLLAMLRRLIDEDVKLETTLDHDAGAVEIDPAQLEQVILNLTLNARDAMPNGGRLRIATAATGSPGDDGDAMVRLTVEDDGEGIDEETRTRIFEPFFTTKDVGKGTGLGLATVYGIVTQLGGRIAVSSEPGSGARFDVFLPRSLRSPTTGPPTGDAGLPRGSGQTLLVVEDDESVCEFVCLVLRGAGYVILAAGDGDEALRVGAAHGGHIDLLLTDIVMPNRNGRSLAEELRARHPGLRVMYMSGYPGDTLQRYDGIPAGDAFLQKPFTREELFHKVADVLRPRPAASPSLDEPEEAMED